MSNHPFPVVLCWVLLLAALLGGCVGGLTFAWFVWYHL